MAIVVAYLTISGWTIYVASALQYNAPLLVSMVSNLLLFALVMLTRYSTILQLSWIWLGANFIAVQAILLPGTNYLVVFGSVVIILFTFDLSNFLELLSPMNARRGVDSSQYERSWLLLKRHIEWAGLSAASSGMLAIAGTAAYVPLVLAQDPAILVAILASALMVLAALLSAELGANARPRGM